MSETLLLNPCGLCGGEAWEQVRGQLKEQPEKSRKKGMPPSRDEKGWVPACEPNATQQLTSNSPANAKDTRIICADCDNSTGWMGAEVADYMRFVWNRENREKVT